LSAIRSTAERHSSDKMSQIIEDLLDFAQIRFKGALPIHPSSMDLRETCREVAHELEAVHPGTAVRLNIPERVPGFWDEKRMNQVLTNIMGNAISHGDGQSVTVWVEEDEAQMRLRVNNGGAVIAPAIQRIIFEPFGSC
jgi:signal transduction histidine kinase